MSSDSETNLVMAGIPKGQIVVICAGSGLDRSVVKTLKDGCYKILDEDIALELGSIPVSGEMFDTLTVLDETPPTPEPYYERYRNGSNKRR